ncbi:MAG: AlpA family transcriptional regulator [Zoogloeaceae bacterium]|jgi:prophage regulatory protein|nr:AlpA family transcriptional regulator [Zoogloeaceae bacterium]
MSQTISRLPAVKSKTGLSRSTIYLKVSNGEFPPPISLGARAVGWIESEIDAWLDAQIEKSRKGAQS